MRKVVFRFILILLFTVACSNSSIDKTQEVSSIFPPELIETPTSEPESEWPEVTGPEPSTRVGAFYYPWYFNPEFDGRWKHWDEGMFNPPVDISSDFYPVLGAYSVSNPMVLAQHFSWLRQAGVGLIISSWWGRGAPSNKALPLILDVADHYGIKIAFHMEPYGGRTNEGLIDDIHYIYDQYGDHPAFYWTTETSCFSTDDRQKGLFFIWATPEPDLNFGVVEPEYWQDAMDTIHDETPGAIVLTDQNDPYWIMNGHFDGSYNYGVLETDKFGYKWALNLPADAWYVPGINPGFSARRIGYEDWVDTPRRDGDTYDDRWERMFAVGVEPTLVAITTFNEWHEGTQIEPAASGVTTPGGYTYLDYGPLGPEGYLSMTRELSEVFLAHEWPEMTNVRIRILTTSDWTDVNLVSGATWQSPNVVSTTGVDARAVMTGERLSLGQPLNQAEAGNQVEAIFDVLFRELETKAPVVFGIERGGLGATWVEVYRLSGNEWLLVESFSWSGHSAGDRNASNFEATHEAIFGDLP